MISATITQVDNNISCDRSFESTSVEIFHLGHVGVVDDIVVIVVEQVVIITEGSRIVTFQVDVTAVSRIVRILLALSYFSNLIIISVGTISIRLANRALFATTEYLEGIAAIHVDGCRAPNFRLRTIATAKHVQGLTQHIVTLYVDDDTRMALGNSISSIIIDNGFTSDFLCYLVKDGVFTFAVDQR